MAASLRPWAMTAVCFFVRTVGQWMPHLPSIVVSASLASLRGHLACDFIIEELDNSGVALLVSNRHPSNRPAARLRGLQHGGSI